MRLKNIFLYKNFILNSEYKKNYIKFLKRFKYDNLNKGDLPISKKKFDIVKKSFKTLIKQSPESYEVSNFFLDAKLKYISKKINIDCIGEQPIIICVEKNDLKKVKTLIEHHKSLGFQYFVFIDNGSTDGTIEFLKKLDNVDIIASETEYYTLAKEAWENRILFYYGFDKWYLILDSDELFNYIGSEKNLINDHIKMLENRGIKRELSFLVDMYSKTSIFSSSEDFKNDFCYFDYNTYKLQANRRFIQITGGPRYRNFISKGKHKEFMLSKYAFFYFEKGDIQSNSHYTFPFYKNLNLQPTSVLMHYKFVDNDLEKYKKIIKSGNYSDGSEDYKLYMQNYEKNRNLNFYYKDSIKFINSHSLQKINILKELNDDKKNIEKDD